MQGTRHGDGHFGWSARELATGKVRKRRPGASRGDGSCGWSSYQGDACRDLSGGRVPVAGVKGLPCDAETVFCYGSLLQVTEERSFRYGN